MIEKRKYTATLRRSASVLFIFAFSALSGCSSYVSPKKVDRVISVDSWRITQFNFNGTDIAADFSGQTLGFGSSGSVTVLPGNGVSGSWNTSLNRKPTLLYIQGFTAVPYFYLNDDWTVVECSKTTIKIESTVGSVTNSVTFLKVEE